MSKPYFIDYEKNEGIMHVRYDVAAQQMQTERRTPMSLCTYVPTSGS